MSPEDDRPKSSERDDLESLFRQVLYLSHRGQLELFELLAQRLSDTSAAPIEQVQSVVRQREALETMQQVAVALNLPEGRAPTTTQFNAQAKTLGLDWNVSSVGRAFSKRQGWRLATQAFERGQLPETARQILRAYPATSTPSGNGWTAILPTRAPRTTRAGALSTTLHWPTPTENSPSGGSTSKGCSPSFHGRTFWTPLVAGSQMSLS